MGIVLLLELLGPHEGEAGDGDGIDSLLLGTGHCAGSHSPPDLCHPIVAREIPGKRDHAENEARD